MMMIMIMSEGTTAANDVVFLALIITMVLKGTTNAEFISIMAWQMHKWHHDIISTYLFLFFAAVEYLYLLF